MISDVHTSEPEQTLVVSRRESLTSDVVMLELRDPTGRELPEWAPGAHIDLVLPADVTRQYSLCGDPSNRQVWTIAVLNALGGRGGSAYVHSTLSEGMSIATRGPRNHFEFAPTTKVLFIAGGIGITPLMPMMTEAAERGLDWELHYGGRSRATMAFAEDLVAGYGSERVRLVPEDEYGFIDLDALLSDQTQDLTVYCCGPAPLLDAVETRCLTWARGSCHTERFTPRRVDHSDDAGFEVELARSAQTVRVPKQCSILEVLESNGVFVPASCREGTCGTCETIVIDGIPDHRDSVLDAEEQESNESMMVCVSRARTPRLVLDL